MNHKFDELTKELAQSVTRRSAIKKFGVGFTILIMTALGIANSNAAKNGKHGNCNHCASPYGCTTDECFLYCQAKCQGTCC